jgi:hypothetical protein
MFGAFPGPAALTCFAGGFAMFPSGSLEMNKSTKNRLMDHHRRKTAALSGRPIADGRGPAKTAFGGSLGFDNGSPSNVSVRELEAYFDEAWRMVGSDRNSWDE